MQVRICRSKQDHQHLAGFSIVETCVAMAIMGILFVSLYAGFLTGFSVIQIARENLRATQVMLEKMETIRLYTWEQINSNGFIPTSFQAAYYPQSGSNVATGMVYNGTLTIADMPVNYDNQYPGYYTNMKMVTVSLSWTSGNIPRNRSMSTFIARYGLQNYIY